jgi:DNA invertase Pin-like site-specific DNA recombinase
MKEYGYCRISTPQQSIDRQERNIKAKYPKAHISRESYTGTKVEGRKELDKILKAVKPGDTIVFDSVSRMSRNADEGIELYEQLFNKGIELVFLKEPHINTATYREALQKQIDVTVNTGDTATDTFINTIIEALKHFQMDLAKKQIELAFAQAEKEVQDLHQRTAEGIQTARLNGKQIGQKQGAKLNVKKKAPAMEQIKKYSKDFDGTLKDTEVMQLVGLARNTYYKYKSELKAEA